MTHKDVLKLLFPVPELGALFDQDLTLEGGLLDSLQTSADALLLEMFPDTATDLIASWERIYNIIPPDGATLADRRLAVVQKKRLRRRLDRAYFIGLAASVGYTITIEELPPSVEGHGPESKFIWRVHVAGSAKTITEFTAGDSGAGDLLTDWPVEAILEDLFIKLKPAHTDVLFVYYA